MSKSEGHLAKGNGMGLMNPVFVVGVFRSGTSLLYSLLNQHPQMAFMYECDALNFPELLSGPRFRGNWLERQEFYNQALSRHRLIYGNSLRGLEKIRTPEDLYKVYGQGKDAILWGEKSPFYCSHLDRIAKRNQCLLNTFNGKECASPLTMRLGMTWHQGDHTFEALNCRVDLSKFFERFPLP